MDPSDPKNRFHISDVESTLNCEKEYRTYQLYCWGVNHKLKWLSGFVPAESPQKLDNYKLRRLILLIDIQYQIWSMPCLMSSLFQIENQELCGHWWWLNPFQMYHWHCFHCHTEHEAQYQPVDTMLTYSCQLYLTILVRGVSSREGIQHGRILQLPP